MHILTFTALSLLLGGPPSLAESKPDALAEAEAYAEAYAELFIDEPSLFGRDLFFNNDHHLAALQERDQLLFGGAASSNLHARDLYAHNFYARDLYRRAEAKPNPQINPKKVNAKEAYSKSMAAYTAKRLNKAQDTGGPVKDPTAYRHGPSDGNRGDVFAGASHYHGDPGDYFAGAGGGRTYQDKSSYDSLRSTQSARRRRALIARTQKAGLIEVS